MKNKYIIIIGVASIIACNEVDSTTMYEDVNIEKIDVESGSEENQQEVVDAEVNSQEIANPNALAFELGDLNKDGIDEKIEVVNTGEMNEDGEQRALNIYKKNDNNEWELWHSSTSVILASEAGGIMGDPFDDIAIENGAIVVYHWGGSSWKWSYTHRYRFQNNNWELIGASNTYGKFCEYWEDFDYNLSTGNIDFTVTTEKCDANGNEVSKSKTKHSYYYKYPKLPTIDNTIPGMQYLALLNDGEEVEFNF